MQAWCFSEIMKGAGLDRKAVEDALYRLWKENKVLEASGSS